MKSAVIAIALLWFIPACGDDDDGGAIQFLQSTFTVGEGLPALLTVVRTGVKLASNVSVDYAVVGGTATPGIDFSLPAGTLNFAANQATQSIPVATVADNLAEGPRTVIVRLSKRAHNPLLKEAGLTQPTRAVPWLGGRCVHLVCP